MQIQLAAGISHELRTPLAVIRSAGYNMAAGHVGNREDIVRYGKLFQDQGQRLSEVVEQALLFAQTHSGKNTYVLQPADVAENAAKVVESCKASHPASEPRLVMRVSDDLPLALTDPAALSHCLRNLIVNAFKYGGSEGPIEIEVHRIDKNGRTEVEISVSDSGPGIERADLPRIFEAFFRGRNAADIQGNGLGLYLVQQTMDSIQGRVAVTSNPGSGSRFSLYVPALPEDTPNA
jgi:signal transduction histidine kinase